MSKIPISRLKVDNLNLLALQQKYSIYKLERSERGKGALLDTLEHFRLSTKVQAMLYKRGGVGYLLCLKNDIPLSELQETLTTYASATIVATPISFADLAIFDLINLLLNALSSSEYPGFQVCNLIGALLLWDQSSVIYYEGSNEIRELHPLRIKVESDGSFYGNIESFVNQQELDSLTPLYRNGKKIPNEEAFAHWPRYTIDTQSGNLIYSVSRKDTPLFINRSLEGVRFNNINYYSYESIDDIEASRTFKLYDIVKAFNVRYDGIVHVSFDEAECVQDVNCNNLKRTAKKYYEKCFAETPVYLVDSIRTNQSQNIVERAQKLLTFGSSFFPPIQLQLSNDFQVNGFNLHLVHSPQYYQYRKEEDKYSPTLLNDQYIIQNIVFEEIPFYNPFKKDGTPKKTYQNGKPMYDTLEPILHKCLTELLIKEAVHNTHVFAMESNLQQTTLLQKAWRFILPPIKREDDVIPVLKTLGDFSFECYMQPISLDNLDIITQVADRLQNHSYYEGAIVTPENEVIYIKRTNYRVMPNISDTIDDLLRVGDNPLGRNKESRDKYAYGVFDIHGLSIDGKPKYYVSGKQGSGISNRTIVKGTVIREFECRDQFTLNNIFDTVLPLMADVTVRSGELTVLPFPFKYLREYQAMQKWDK